MKTPQSLFTASLFLALAAGIGCSGSSTTAENGTGGATPTDDGKAIAGIDVTPNKDTLSKGSTLQLFGTVRRADGTTADITKERDAVWNTSDPTVATVTKDGLVTAQKEGMVEITVEYKGVKGTEKFVVMP